MTPANEVGLPDSSEPEAERADCVLIVEITDVTWPEWEAVVAAVKSTLIPLGTAGHVRMHAAIHDVAERVMDAYEGRRTNQ